ncbi:MAG: glycoside hydrolase family 28 protein [Lewinellaceae bacterium]|nr:glycoside hydrolase family 28 protein [Lewinellaceae bacterium]
MRNLTYFIILIILAGCKTNPPEQVAGASWAQMEQILASIEPPVFPDKVFDISDFGAPEGGQEDCLPAIMAAVEKCHAEGGGTVEIPAGQYLANGPIHLKSNVNLHLSEGATVRFSTNPEDYLPVAFTRWEGVECMNYSPLIYALGQENIAITGKGTLDGQADSTNWWRWVDNERYGWEEGMPSQKDSLSRPRLFDWNTREVPPEERILGEGAYLRPNFIQPYRCRNVLIDSVTILNSPMWVIHPVLSENVTIQNVKVVSHGPNSDGCDPESCRNVLIKNCYFDTGDDCIALKSGRNQDGRRIGRPIENVVVQGCRMKDGHGGVVIGSEVSGGARNIFAEDCQMDSPNLDRAIRVKTNKVRGGTIENLYFRNIMVGEVGEAVVRVNMRYPIYSDTNQTFIPVVQHIFIDNVQSSKSEYGVLIDGYSREHPVNGVELANCRFDGAEKGNSIEFAENLVFEEFYLNGELIKTPDTGE